MTRTRDRWIVPILTVLLAATPALAGSDALRDRAQPAANSIITPTRPQPPIATIQITLLLDTSNSMDGLINQARAALAGGGADLEKTMLGAVPEQLKEKDYDIVEE